MKKMLALQTENTKITEYLIDRRIKMRVYKPTYKDKRTGRKKQCRRYVIDFIDNNKIRQRLPAFPNKRETERAAEKIEWLLSCYGRPLDPELSKWLSQIPPKMYQQLIEFELSDAKQLAVGKPLIEHLEDFKRSLLAKGDTVKHAQLVFFRVKRIFNECKFEYWSDISLSTIQQKISDLQNQVEVVEIKKIERKKVKKRKLKNIGEASTKTKNYYIKSLKQFGSWMVNDQRVSESPFRYLKNISSDGTERHPRRPLEIDEARRLLESTQAAPERFGMTGYERALLYRLAIETGLRANELRNLAISSFNLKTCTVTAVATYSKNRKEYTLPLKKDTATILKSYFAGRMPGAKAFRVPDKPIDMLRPDLEDAKIPYVDDAGRYADFHALRHTTGSFLVASGAHPKVVQSIMRHSDINLTMGRYTHIFRGQESKAVAKLPDLSLSSKKKQTTTATGTDDVPLNDLTYTGKIGVRQRISANSDEQTNRDDDSETAVLNAPGRTRTCNLRIRSPRLYPIELRAQKSVSS